MIQHANLAFSRLRRSAVTRPLYESSFWTSRELHETSLSGLYAYIGTGSSVGVTGCQTVCQSVVAGRGFCALACSLAQWRVAWRGWRGKAQLDDAPSPIHRQSPLIIAVNDLQQPSAQPTATPNCPKSAPGWSTVSPRHIPVVQSRLVSYLPPLHDTLSPRKLPLRRSAPDVALNRNLDVFSDC